MSFEELALWLSSALISAAGFILFVLWALSDKTAEKWNPCPPEREPHD